MLVPYAPEHLEPVTAFARRLSNWDYVRMIIRYHTVDGQPGGCWVWRVGRRVVAFCGMLYLNRDDAWLYGMRVDPDVKSRGIATRFTRELFRIAARAGRTWAGLNTLDHGRPAPVFRIAEKLGMTLDALHATDPFWDLPRRFPRPRLKPFPGIYRHFINQGQSTYFHEHPGWLWSRLLPGRSRELNRDGCLLHGVPLHIKRHGILHFPDGWVRSTTVNFYDRPDDFRPLLKSLFAFGAGKHNNLTLNYPAEWRRELHAAARAVAPELERGKKFWFTVWRIYGKRLDKELT